MAVAGIQTIQVETIKTIILSTRLEEFHCLRHFEKEKSASFHS